MSTITFYLISLGLVFGVVWGIHLMNKPQTAVKGNLLGALCILGSIILTMSYYGILDVQLLWISMVIGGLIGYIWSLWVKICLLYTSPSPRDRTRSRMPSSA